MSTSYKPLNVKSYDIKSITVSDDKKYWDEPFRKQHYVIKQDYPSFNIDAHPTNYDMVIATCGASVIGYKASAGVPYMKFSRAKSNTHGAVFREDGQLIVIGTTDSYVHLVKATGKENTTLRVFKGHEGPVQRVRFVPNQNKIVTFSDDKTIGVWDIAEELRIMTLKGHEDSVRVGCVNPSDTHMVISGSQDKTVRLWDTRTGDSVGSLDHGALHLNDALCHPAGYLLATAAGCEVKLWDIRMGRTVVKLAKHHREVMCLRYSSKHTRLMSGGLDKHINVYDAKYNVAHTFTCDASVISFDVTRDDKSMVVSTNASGKGYLTIHKKQALVKPVEFKPKSSFRVLPAATSNLHIVRQDRSKEVLQECDKYLKSFKFTEYLQKALKRNNPCEVVAMLSELVRIGKVHVAVAGEDRPLLNALFAFLARHLSHVAYAPVLFQVVDALLDVYVDDVRQGTWIDMKLMLLLDKEVPPSSSFSSIYALANS